MEESEITFSLDLFDLSDVEEDVDKARDFLTEGEGIVLETFGGDFNNVAGGERTS